MRHRIFVLSMNLLAACGGASEPLASSPVERPPATGDRAQTEPDSPGDGETKKVAKETLPEVIARASIVPLVESIRPGRAFWMAVRLDVLSGYRVSWTYAGDVGREIRVTFMAPAGFEVGRVRYPAPQRFDVNGHVAYGWTDRTAAFVEITPPRQLSRSAAHRIDVKADWLACKQQCLRESSEAYVELSSSWSGGQRVEDAELDPLFAQIPKPFADDKDAKTEWVGEPSKRRVALSVEGVLFKEFIPATEETRKAVTAKSGDGGLVVLEFEAPPEPPPHATHGVLLGEREGQRVAYELDLPWSAEDEAETELAKPAKAVKKRRR